jgi:glycosyltransferase involved in cell wall biosynthesis
MGHDFLKSKFRQPNSFISLHGIFFPNFWVNSSLMTSGKFLSAIRKVWVVSVVLPLICVLQFFLINKIRPDSVIVSSGGLPGGLSNLPFCLVANLFRFKKKVFIVRSDALRTPLNSLLSSILIRGKWEVVTISRAILESLPIQIHNNLRVHLIYPAALSPPTGKVKAKLPDSNKKFKILQVGHLAKRKGHEVAISALGKLIETHGPVIEFDCVGADVIEKGVSRLTILQKHVADLGLHKSVRFHGHCNDLLPFYSSADVLILPSIEDESFGRVLIEAMSHEIPVVGSMCDGIIEIIDDGETGLFSVPGCHLSLQVALAKIFDSPPLAAAIAKKGHRKFLKQFSVQKNISEYKNIFM